MSVRLSLLAILDQGECYGYQARRELERRTGAARPLNAGQIFNTLERLERDGLVARGEADDAGHVFWRITPAGSEEAAAWLAEPVARGEDAGDVLAQKVALAASLPGVGAATLLAAQRAATESALERLRSASAEGEGDDLSRALSADAARLRAEADLRWLDAAEARLAARADHSVARELSAERPRRGRPTRQPDPAPAG